MLSDVPTGILLIIFMLMMIACFTRFLSGRSYYVERTSTKDMRNVPQIPYWIPFIGLFFSYMIDPDCFLRKQRYVLPDQRTS